MVGAAGFEPAAKTLCLPLQFSLTFRFVVWTVSYLSVSPYSLYTFPFGLGSGLAVKPSPTLTNSTIVLKDYETLHTNIMATHWSSTMLCQICQKPLSGRQSKYCSVQCKFKSTNIKHQQYQNQQKRGLERKIQLIKFLGGCCHVCSYKRNVAALDFHHKKPEEKSFGIDIRKCSNSTMESLMSEAQKCIILCSRCHRESHNPELNDLL